MDPALESILRRLTKPRRRRDEKEAITELQTDWRSFENELVECLRTPTLDEQAAHLGYRSKSPRQLILEALLQEWSWDRAQTMLFLLDDPDRKIRSDFASLLAASGDPVVLEQVDRCLHDPNRHVRAYATYGLRDAVCADANSAFTKRAVELLLDLLVRHPGDRNYALFQALEHADPASVVEAERLVALGEILDEDQPFFRLMEAKPPWGDYGHVLVNGISWHEERDSMGRLQLERTGPYVPPITFPDSGGDIVVTEDYRKLLESSGLTGFSFAPVVKRRIVLLNWERWDRQADPEKYPAGGEPENYVLKRKHREHVAEQMPNLFEVQIAESGLHPTELLAQADPQIGDFARTTLSLWPNVVSKQAMGWLRETATQWVRFENLSRE